MAQLARTARRRRIALVGHEPGLGELAAHLLGAKRPMAFRKGGVCRIDLQGLTEKRPGIAGLVRDAEDAAAARVSRTTKSRETIDA